MSHPLSMGRWIQVSPSLITYMISVVFFPPLPLFNFHFLLYSWLNPNERQLCGGARGQVIWENCFNWLWEPECAVVCSTIDVKRHGSDSLVSSLLCAIFGQLKTLWPRLQALDHIKYCLAIWIILYHPALICYVCLQDINILRYYKH